MSTWIVAFTIWLFPKSQKVFDLVNQKILINKFMAYGVTDSALDLLSSYLTYRKQKCQVNGISSQLRKIHHGVPQESILGPILLVYIKMIYLTVWNMPHLGFLQTTRA